MKRHIDYIDLLKGVSIFGVVWFHSLKCPDWLTATVVNSIFFFMSGIFFKTEKFLSFVKKKAKVLLIPFFVFYILSYPYRILEHYWDYRTLSDFDWKCILDIFEISGKTDYLFINVPLWFILCLFVIQIIYYFISRMNKFIIVILILFTIFFQEFINDIPSPFMINNAFYWVGFFAAGNLVGKFLIEKMKIIKNRIILFASSILAIILLSILNEHYLQTEYSISVIYQFKMFCVFGIMFSVGPFFDGWKVLKPIRFLGTNSLAILCMHVPILIVFSRIANKLLNYDVSSSVGFICALFTCLVCYYPIVLCNKYCPIIVGKKPKVKSTNDIQSSQTEK